MAAKDSQCAGSVSISFANSHKLSTGNFLKSLFTFSKVD